MSGRLPVPSFYDPSAVPLVRVERADVVAEAAVAYRRAHGVRPAAEDRVRVAAFGIDAQIAFCTPGASLFVPGAVEDTARTLGWLYGNLDRLTTLVFSLDTHAVHQIFHPSYWTDESGGPPAPFTVITAADVAAGRFTPAREREAVLEYLERLERGGRYVLTIWPYHALLGGVSHALVPALMEAAIFHALVRDAEPRFEIKGREPLTESYSVLAPEVQELGGARIGRFNDALVDALVSHDRVYVFGQAKSHCVLATLRDLERRLTATDPRLLAKVHVLEDATSPVAPPRVDPLPPELDFPAVAARAFAELAAAGMKVVTTRDPV